MRGLFGASMKVLEIALLVFVNATFFVFQVAPTRAGFISFGFAFYWECVFAIHIKPCAANLFEEAMFMHL